MIFLPNETHPEHWRYLAEGAEAIVCSYSGPPHPTFDGTVIRLRKTSATMSGSNLEAAASSINEVPGSFEFHERVIRKLVDPQFLDEQRLVAIDTNWLQLLHESIDYHRPLKRREASTLDFSSPIAVLATNLIGHTGWGVEIKVNAVQSHASIPRDCFLIFK